MAMADVISLQHHWLEVQRREVGAHGERERARRGRHRQGRDLRQRREGIAAQVHLVIRPRTADHHVRR